MSSTAQKQDLTDPEVVSQFAARVNNERRLTALYLLTVADIRGTSPQVWNSWKARLLEELFRSTRRLLRGDSAVNAHWLAYKRRDTLARLKLDDAPPIWAHVDDRYFQRFDVDDLTWHAAIIGDGVSPESASVHARADEGGDLFDVLVMASNREGLFARITGAFERLHLDIVSARIYTTTHGYALDTFLVMPKHSVTTNEVISKIERELKRAIDGKEMTTPPTTRQSRQAKHFPLVPEISLRPRRSSQQGLFELSVTCSDRPGLLSRIARTLHDAGVSIHDARVTTLGSRAEDVFVIESTELVQGAATEALRSRLVEVTR